MKNIYLLISCLICTYSHSQIEETQVFPRWQVLGSNKDGSVLLKLEEGNSFNLSFRNYQFSDKEKIQNIYFNSSDLDISNLYDFLYKSFDLTEFEQSSFKIDKYEFQVSKSNNHLKVIIRSIKSNEIFGWMLISITGLNNLFGKY